MTILCSITLNRLSRPNNKVSSEFVRYYLREERCRGRAQFEGMISRKSTELTVVYQEASVPGWHRRSSRRLKTENSENPNLETLHERPKIMDDAQQRKKTPEPAAFPPAAANQAENTSSVKPGNSGALSSAPEVLTERRASLTNVVRPMIQTSTSSSLNDATTRSSIQSLRLPTVDDTDTSTGGESPVLMRRRSYNNVARDTHNKARYSLPIRAGEGQFLMKNVFSRVHPIISMIG